MPVRSETLAVGSRAQGRSPLLASATAAGSFLVVILVGYPLGYRNVDLWGAFGVPILLAVLTVPLFAMERRRPDGLAGLFALALAAKFIGAYLRYLMVFHLYEAGDAARYHGAGASAASEFWAGRASTTTILPGGQGTAFIERLTGFVETLFGQSAMGGFMVYSWLSFLGLVLFVAAARRAVPNLRVRRYAVLVLFLPSMVFWPSSIGKDAWVLFGLGLFVYGAARMLTRARLGWLLVLAGCAATGVVRPHITLLALAAFAAALLFVSSSRSGQRPVGLGVRVIGIGLLVIGFTFALSQASDILPNFQNDDGSYDVSATLETTTVRTSQGGSEIETITPNSPLEYPIGFFTVMFRPLLIEARSATTAVAAIESTALLVMVVVWRRSIVAGVRQAGRNPYVLMVGLYTLAFGFAFSSVNNLGIISRQRVQVLPFLVLFLCLADGVGRTRSANRATTQPLALPSVRSGRSGSSDDPSSVS